MVACRVSYFEADRSNVAGFVPLGNRPLSSIDDTLDFSDCWQPSPSEPSQRRQRTIASSASVAGVGLFTNADVTVTFHPAATNTGIRFRRLSEGQPVEIPALRSHLVDTPRHTSLQLGEARVEMVEHTLAALAGLQIDNCLVEVDGPELPGLDGSSAPTVAALMAAAIVEQGATVEPFVISQSFEVSDGRGGTISAEPSYGSDGLELTYLLDHPNPAVGRQSASHTLLPESFAAEIAPARTFVLEEEVAALLAAGYGQRLTHQDLCVFGPDGLIENSARFENEPARHKLLDCIGDFALAGAPIIGRIVASKSGHALNHRFVQELLRRHPHEAAIPQRFAA